MFRKFLQWLGLVKKPEPTMYLAPSRAIKLKEAPVTEATKARVAKVEADMKAAGVRSLHPFFDYEELAKGETTKDQLLNSICAMYEKVLAGDVTEVTLNENDELVPLVK